MIGKTVSHYQIVEKLGEGGMGVVYKARDLTLGRFVAMKFLHPSRESEEERHRFIHEARAASTLDHPNICTVYEVGEADETQMFLAMAYYEGETLQKKIDRGPLALEEATSIGLQVANGLAKAHLAGITHRDLKPSNIMLTNDGLVKILDFGLAKLTGATKITKTGSTMGTPRYMSPEQVQGMDLDPRSDIWSFGVLLWEMLTGTPAFKGEHEAAVYYGILNIPPIPVGELRSDAPESLQRVIHRVLVKDREKRLGSAEVVVRELQAVQRELAGAGPAPSLASMVRRRMRQPRFAIPVLSILLALGVLAGWWWAQISRVRWAQNEALPEARRLAGEGRLPAAWLLARQAEEYIPENKDLEVLMDKVSFDVSLRTTPPGAEVFWRDAYATGGSANWERLGVSPLENVKFPIGYLRLRLEKPGFNTAEAANVWVPGEIHFTLPPEGAAPEGMVFVPAGPSQFGVSPPVEVQDYWIDRFEVTNDKFKKFADANGYQNAEYWRHPVVRDGETLTFDETMNEFRDLTGRPGPSTWELGTYPKGHEKFPVGGVSWYEAAAYCEFAGKSLPTAYHWDRAAGTRIPGPSGLLMLSNFDVNGPAPVGTYQGLGPYGTYDMAGNVKEWSWNEWGGERYILGGSWGEPHYTFSSAFRMPPLDRSKTHGFRCFKYSAPPAETLLAPIEVAYRDFRTEEPVDARTFEIYRQFHAYDKTPLNAVVGSVDESPEYWRKETVTLDAAYGGERVMGRLYLPKNAAPPYQIVIYVPSSVSLVATSSENMVEELFFDFIIRSGRAVMLMVGRDMYERRVTTGVRGPNLMKDLVIQWSKDLGRLIDYLETREDIDTGKLGYCGLSTVGWWGTIQAAVEPRIKTSIYIAGGLMPQRFPPEIDPLNFAPRVRIPVLMLNGRYDSLFPVETNQLVLFRLLGSPEKDKRHIAFESGHFPPFREVIKESLDWLDHYLGPVR